MNADQYEDVPPVLRPKTDMDTTQQMNSAELRALLAATLRPSTNSQSTPSMKAVVVPSARPSQRPTLNTELCMSEMGDEPLADSLRGSAL